MQLQVFASEGLSHRNVEVLTMNGEFTLTGRVENEEIERNALKIAAEAEGVTRVDDQLTIDPTWRARLEAQEHAPKPAN